MKKIILITLAAFLLVASCSGCGQNSSKTVNITPDNYSEYFFIKLNYDEEYWDSALSGDTQFDITITIKAESKKSALFDNVVLKGYVQLPLDKRDLPIYTEKILPVEATININGTGSGETTAMFSHGVGPYGGYADTDFYFECTSASGSITLK